MLCQMCYELLCDKSHMDKRNKILPKVVMVMEVAMVVMVILPLVVSVM